MKNLILIGLVVLVFGCSPAEKSQLLADNLGSGPCTKCGCRSWRGDSDEPERCVNARVPTKALCQHLYEAHKSN